MSIFRKTKKVATGLLIKEIYEEKETLRVFAIPDGGSWKQEIIGGRVHTLDKDGDIVEVYDARAGATVIIKPEYKEKN